MQREVGVEAAEARDKVLLVSGDGAFSGIGEVQVRRNELESDSGVLHNLFEAGWELVVDHFKARHETTIGEVSVEGGLCAN